MGKRTRGIRLLTQETLRELAFHNRWFHVCIWSLLLLLMAGRSLTELPLGPAAPKLLFDVGQGAILSFGAIVLILMLAHHVFQELETGTASAYLVHGLTRGDYLLGKLLGSWLAVVGALLLGDALLSFLTALEANDLNALGQDLALPGLAAWVQLFLMQSMQLLVLGSLTLCMASLSRTFLFAVLTSLLIWSIGLFLGGAAEAEPASGISNWMMRLAGLIVPRFEMWDISSRLWYEGPMSMGSLLASSLTGLLYAAVLFSAALFLFNRREL